MRSLIIICLLLSIGCEEQPQTQTTPGDNVSVDTSEPCENSEFLGTWSNPDYGNMEFNEDCTWEDPYCGAEGVFDVSGDIVEIEIDFTGEYEAYCLPSGVYTCVFEFDGQDEFSWVCHDQYINYTDVETWVK